MSTPHSALLPPFWNIVSVLLPVLGSLLAIAFLLTAERGEYAGALGRLFGALIALGAVCLLGEAAAITALLRHERMPWLSVLGIVLNLVVIVPAALLAMHAE
jgi:hypothetical protein